MQVNAGCGGRPDTLPADGRYPIDTLVVRDFLASSALPGGGRLTAAALARQVATLPGNASTASGGVLPAGNILVVAQPYARDAADAADGGYIFEGDRDGGEVRTEYPAHEVMGGDHALYRSPPQSLLSTNHWHAYKTDPWEKDFWAIGAGAPTCPSAQPKAAAVAADGVAALQYDIGGAVSFSSLHRYKSGLSFATALHRTHASAGTAEARAALRAMAEGATEHSIVFRPNQLTFDIAVASMAGGALWDAPYEKWVAFTFEEVFLP